MAETETSATKSKDAKPEAAAKPAQGTAAAGKAPKRSAKSALKNPAKKPAKKDTPPAEPLFFGRDESWMLFNQRVLEEAEDPSNPLLERVKFLAITASNLDEFIEIRVASLLQHIEDGFHRAATCG